MFLVISWTNSPEFLSIIADSEYFFSWSIALNKITSLFTTLTLSFSDFDRNFGFGRIHKKVLDAYNRLWEATERTLEIIKPGTSCSEIYSKLSQSLITNKVSVGRMGHGLGLQLTEPPSIMKNDKTLLEKNMIITLEPSIEMDANKRLVQE